VGYRDARPGLARGVTAALVVWGSTVMLHSATRIAAVPLAIAVALMAWHLETDDDDRLREGSSPAV
jgi:hypothetical protein